MGKSRDTDDDERDLEDYARRLRFSMHQLAMRSTQRTEQDFEADLSTLGVLPGMPEFDEAKRAWLRFQKKDVRSVY